MPAAAFYEHILICFFRKADGLLFASVEAMSGVSDDSGNRQAAEQINIASWITGAKATEHS